MRLLIASVLAVISLASARAEDAPTVQSLIMRGYEIVAVFATSAGAGMVLQRGDNVMMCLVAETAKSPDVVTRYCKPVH